LSDALPIGHELLVVRLGIGRERGRLLVSVASDEYPSKKRERDHSGERSDVGASLQLERSG